MRFEDERCRAYGGLARIACDPASPFVAQVGSFALRIGSLGMPKLTRIYTRTGDDGTTGLVGGQRIKKNALRIEAYGTIDELSSVIGLARTALVDVRRTRPVQDVKRAHERAAELDAWLAWTQDVLFNLGSDLATLPKDRWEGMPLVTAADATALERAIDRAQTDLEPLANFIHPGGAVCAFQRYSG